MWLLDDFRRDLSQAVRANAGRNHLSSETHLKTEQKTCTACYCVNAGLGLARRIGPGESLSAAVSIE